MKTKEKKQTKEKITKKTKILGERKKSLGLLIVAAVLLVAIAAGFVIHDNKVNNDKGDNQTSALKDFYQYYNSDELKVIYFMRTGCSWCEKETPIIKTIAQDNNLDYYTIDASKFTKNQVKEIIGKLGIEESTPTTVIVKGGKVLATKVGYVEGSVLTKFFQDNGIISTDYEYKEKTQKSIDEEDYPNLTFIGMEEYEKLVSSKKSIVVTVGQTGCSHCTATKPVINEVAGDYDIKFYYLNLTDMTDTERKDFFNSLTTLEYDDATFKENGSIGTPLTLIIKNNKIQSYISGEAAYAKYVKLLKKYSIINGD